MLSRDTAEAVQRMQDYIALHMAEPITLSQLAREAGYSPCYAARIFHEMTGKPPFEYIRALRLSRAALTLRDEKRRVVDVALNFLFDSHEGFTRAFSKQFGLPPRTYRKTAPPIGLFMPDSVRHNYLSLHPEKEDSMMEKESIVVFSQVMERPVRRLLLKRGIAAKDYFGYCEEVGCDVWGVFSSVGEALYEPAGFWLPEKLIRPGTSPYVQGVELPLDYDKPVPDGFEVITLEPALYFVFQGPPYPDDAFQDAIGSIWKAIERFDPKLYGYEWDPQAAPRFQLAPMGYRGYIEARPVRRIG